jgi:hypothetical protein
MRATSRDPEDWQRATEAARVQRTLTAHEVAGRIAEQVEANLIEGDAMGGRARLAVALRAIAVAEGRGDQVALRAALLDVSVAGAAWVAALDFKPPAAMASQGEPAP